MRRSMLLAALCVALVLAMAPATFAQQQASPELPLDQYGCVPQQAYVPEAGGCVASEGLTPGTDPQVIDPDTGEELGALSGFVGEPSDQYASSFAPCPLGLDQYPAGTACGEGGSYFLPNGLPAQGTLSQGGGEQFAEPQATTPTQTAQPAAEALPATGGPSLALLAGALLVSAGLTLRRR